jgi:integrase
MEEIVMKKGQSKDLTVVNNGKEVNNYSEYMNSNISGYIWKTEQKEINDDELQRQLIQGVVYKDRVDRLHHDYKISTIDLNKEIEDFLNNENRTKVTKNCYNDRLKIFLSWCNEKGINPLKITRMEAENYLYHLATVEYKPGKKYANCSIRAMVLGIQSFYNQLHIRYSNIININVFHKLKLPKVKLERRQDKIRESDIKVLKEKFKNIGRNDIVCAIDIFYRYGYRLGIFEEMKLNKDGNWTAVSKGHDMKGKFTKRETERIFATKLLELKKVTLRNIITKYTKRLYQQGKISCPFSCHDIRHFHITKEINKLPDGKKLIEISRRFHKNLDTTMRYYDD